MIIFTPFHDVKDVLMQVRPDSYDFYEFNLSNPCNCGVSLAALIPNPEYIPQDVILGCAESPEFDIAYGKFIMENQEQFFTFMRMMTPLYNIPNACVIIYIQYSPMRDAILESLMKLIQQRYGYHPYLVNSLEDLYCVKDDCSFSVRGIVNMQEDSDRALIQGFYGQIVIPEE